ncbi:MAG: glycosyltransferase [Anaerolineae bacterium]|nr:glycosyltransferase [Anaerolineae bacterium]
MNTKKPKSFNPPLLKIVSIITTLYFVYYLWWRATATLNPSFPFFSWALWLTEAFGVITYILFAWLTKNIGPIVPHKKPAPGISVDIYVPTFNEDVEILEATLIGCRKVRYPHTTYVLDDGNRPVIQALANRLGCRYIARPTHEHAKAGNINHALQQTDGEYIVILDADMVPQPDFLHRTLGYFEDEKLALIQLPQEFYNQDSIQHASNQTSWHEQSLFFRVIQPGKNYTNSAFWCGSPSVVRRKALFEVGGVATETITEDIHTTVRLHSRGWKTLFVNEPLAFGIAPQTIRAFLLQRLRWAQGTMQLYRSKESPLWVPGLSLRQRASYLSSFLAYFEAFQKIILILMPILIIGLNIFPMEVSITSFAIHWIPYFTLNIFANQLGGRGVFHYFKTEKFNILKSIIFIQASFTLVSKKPLKFQVTPKALEENVYRQERRSMRWFIALFGILVGCMSFALIRMVTPNFEILFWDVYAIALFWAGYNTYVISLALKEVLTKKHERLQYRFPIHARGKLSCITPRPMTIKVLVSDLSISGVGFDANEWFPEEANDLELTIYPKDFSKVTIPISKVFMRGTNSPGLMRFGAVLSEDLGPQRALLFEYLFVHLPRSNAQTLYQVNEWNPFHVSQKPSQRAQM